MRKTKATLAQPSAPQKGGPRRQFIDHRREYNKALDLIKAHFSLPEGAYVTDVHSDLAKVSVPYDSDATDASLWRGAVVDYRRGVVIKYGVLSSLVRVANDTKLEDVVEAQPEEGDIFYYTPVFDGALVSVFKYKGTVYFSTGRSLGVNKSAHVGATNISDGVRNNMPEGLLESLFQEDIPTGIYHYDFILLEKGTLDVTKAPVAIPALIFTNRGRLSNSVSGYARTVEIVSDKTLNETQLFPNEPGFYASVAKIPTPIAQDWFSGAITGHREDVLAISANKDTEKVKKMVRIQSEEAHARHLVRGDVANVAVRLTEIIGDYEYDEKNGELVPWDARKSTIRIGANVDMMDAVKAALVASLPDMRQKDIDTAYELIKKLKEKLVHYFTVRYNPKHPAAPYWQATQGLTQSQIEDKIWRIDQNVLFQSLRWYKLI
jgi:hypothetical protein